jgi:hypothetical protein
VPRAWTGMPGRTWEWCVGQFEGRDYWEPNVHVRVRRKCWPGMYLRKGLVLPAGCGMTHTVDEDTWHPWHVWRYQISGSYPPSTFWGWGGAIGADHDDDQYVFVCGQPVHDGTGYDPSQEDLVATDWERI